MKRWIKKLERLFVSVAFAETGEHNDARSILGIKHVDPRTLWDEIFISVTFAEAG